MNFTLFPFQEEGVQFALSHHYSIIGDEMGVGKTVMAIELINRTRLQTLIVCPAYLQSNWRKELFKFLETHQGILQPQIISYSAIAKNENLFQEADLVICDEFHYIKNLKSKRSQALHDFMYKYRPKRFLGLTGTAIKNRVSEFYSLLGILDYNNFNTSGQKLADLFPNYYSFCDFFSYREEKKFYGRRVISYRGARNIDELRKLLRDKYIRRKSKDVLELPPIVRQTIEIGGREAAELKGALNSLQEGDGVFHFSRVKKQSAMVKAEFTKKHVKSLIEAGEGPVLVFSDHVDSTLDMASSIPNSMAITGATSMQARSDYVDQFQAGELDCLCATIGSMSVGVTLTQASVLIFNDISWVPGDIAQAEKRIHRIGQDGERCLIQYIAWGPIDAKIIETVNEKIKILSEVL